MFLWQEVFGAFVMHRWETRVAVRFTYSKMLPILPLFFLAHVKANKMARKRNKAISFKPTIAFVWIFGLTFQRRFLSFSELLTLLVFTCVLACVASYKAQSRSLYATLTSTSPTLDLRGMILKTRSILKIRMLWHWQCYVKLQWSENNAERVIFLNIF